MKNILFISLAILIAFFASCTKEDSLLNEDIAIYEQQSTTKSAESQEIESVYAIVNNARLVWFRLAFLPQYDVLPLYFINNPGAYIYFNTPQTCTSCSYTLVVRQYNTIEKIKIRIKAKTPTGSTRLVTETQFSNQEIDLTLYSDLFSPNEIAWFELVSSDPSKNLYTRIWLYENQANQINGFRLKQGYCGNMIDQYITWWMNPLIYNGSYKIDWYEKKNGTYQLIESINENNAQATSSRKMFLRGSLDKLMAVKVTRYNSTPIYSPMIYFVLPKL